MKDCNYEKVGSWKYFKNNLLVSLALFLSAISSGIVIFKTETIQISPQKQQFIFLFHNNFLVCLTIIVAGLLSFGILGNFVLFANGVVVGRVIVGVYNLYGITPLLRYLAPHFIFEISALLIATAISQETYKFFYNFRHPDIKVICLRYDLRAFVMMNILLVIAALIESNL